MAEPVIIAGAGPGGLTAALALQAQGMPVLVFESVATLKPLGVGINLLPHAVRVLDALSSRTARLPEQIAARAGLSADSARAALGRLTLEGWVRSDERGFMRARTRASDGGAAQHAGS